MIVTTEFIVINLGIFANAFFVFYYFTKNTYHWRAGLMVPHVKNIFGMRLVSHL
jgi:hypothetical protein